MTRIVTCRNPDGGFEARVGFAILGWTKMSDGDLKDANPFDDPPAFDNAYAVGQGATEEEAITAMKADMRLFADDLFSA